MMMKKSSDGKRIDHVGEAHQQIIDPATGIARDQANRYADQ